MYKSKIADGIVHYSGDFRETMEDIVESGLHPLGVADIMQLRFQLFSWRAFPGDRGASVHRHLVISPLTTADAIAYHMHGTVKIQPDSKVLKDIGEFTELDERGMVRLSGPRYKGLEATVFTRDEVRDMDRGFFRDCPIVSSLFVGRENVLRQYHQMAGKYLRIFPKCPHTDNMHITPLQVADCVSMDNGETYIFGRTDLREDQIVLAVTPEFKEKYLRSDEK